MSANHRIKKLKEYLVSDPNDTFSRFALALELLKTDQTGKALEHFEYIVANKPEYTGTYYHLGKIYQQTGNHKKALDTFEKGRELAENEGDLHTAQELQQAIRQLENGDC